MKLLFNFDHLEDVLQKRDPTYVECNQKWSALTTTICHRNLITLWFPWKWKQEEEKMKTRHSAYDDIKVNMKLCAMSHRITNKSIKCIATRYEAISQSFSCHKHNKNCLMVARFVSFFFRFWPKPILPCCQRMCTWVCISGWVLCHALVMHRFAFNLICCLSVEKALNENGLGLLRLWFVVNLQLKSFLRCSRLQEYAH